MSKTWICLDTFDKIKKFVNITAHLDYELDLVSGRYVIDGKSIMGIFSLDLSQPIEIKIVNNEDYYAKEIEEFMIH